MNDEKALENEKDIVTVQGIVDRVVYHNEDNGYTVCELAIGEAELITLVGNMPFLREGETIHAAGQWVLHHTYGRQFSVEAYEKELPSTESAILKYLSSRSIKGIGPISAKRIVEKYGEDTFDVIENHPDWLSEISGISPARAKSIGEDFKKQFGIRAVMMFCRDFFGPSVSLSIYHQWGAGAVDVIKQNPYALCDQIYGISFKKADEVAHTLGMTDTDANRIKSAIMYILSSNGMQNGHMYIPKKKLNSSIAEWLSLPEEDVISAYESLIDEKKLVELQIKNRICAYLAEAYEAEKYIAEKTLLLDSACLKIGETDIDRFITKIELEQNIEYAKMQKKAISGAINHGIMILTGGPGTGKTTVIRAVISIFESMGMRIALAAPTGRAAKRMSEATSCEAKTIHRLLEMEFNDEREPQFRRNEKCLLEEDVIIIDEVSMVDTMLMSSLLRATKTGAHLMLIGDADQLPSVGAGNVLHDLIECERFNVIELKEIFRQASESLIVTNAHLINEGEYPTLDSNNRDFFFLPRESDVKTAETVVELISKRLPRRYGADIARSIQVITPSRKGEAGTETLNVMLQKTLNPSDARKREHKVRNTVFREGDKVMQIRNNYDIEWSRDSGDGQGIFNGDIGIIERLNIPEETAVLNFDDRIAVYDFSQMDELEHAYAITVHKSQGSEYPIVIIPSYYYTPKLLTRNLLYTAVTRAQSMVIIVGRGDVICGMVDNNIQAKRYTGLKYMLQDNEDEDD